MGIDFFRVGPPPPPHCLTTISTLEMFSEEPNRAEFYIRHFDRREFDLRQIPDILDAGEIHKREWMQMAGSGGSLSTENSTLCIHLESTAEVLRAGKKKTLKLKELIVGDIILGYDTKKKTPVYTKLIMWAHTDTITPTKFLHFELEDGSEIKLTAEHMIMVGQLYHAKMAKHVEVGNLLYKKNVGFLKVSKISQVIEVGFCCPITDSGNIMVNGILTSCFAHLSDISIFGKTFISAQTIGRVGFLPFMAYRKMLKDGGKAITNYDEQSHPYLIFILKAFAFLLQY